MLSRVWTVTALFWVLSAVPAQPGVLETTAGRLQGRVAFESDRVRVDDQVVPWTDVLYGVANTAAEPPPGSQRLRMKNGEVWAVKIVGLTEGRLDVVSGLFGAKRIDVARVAAVEFAPSPRWHSDRKEGVLYRRHREPVPGDLQRIQKGRATIDSLVGLVDLPLQELTSYQWAKEEPKRSAGEDEVAFVDGSVLRGKLTTRAGVLEMTHPLLGCWRLPSKRIRAVWRHSPRLLDLTERQPRVETTPLIAAGEDGGRAFRLCRGGAAARGLGIQGLAIEPETRVRYDLPGRRGQKGRLTFMVAPAPGTEGDMRLTVALGKRLLFDRAVAAKAPVTACSLDVAAGEPLEFGVRFGERLRFPCGVVLSDPHVVWQE